MPGALQGKTAGQRLSSTGPGVPERHSETEEVTGSNPVRPTRHFLSLALPGTLRGPTTGLQRALQLPGSG